MKPVSLVNGGLLALSLWLPGLANAFNVIEVTFPPVNFDEPRDIATVWTPIATAEGTQVDVCGPVDAPNAFTTITLGDGGNPAIGTMTFDGIEHSVYESNVNGIGWILSARVTSFTDENGVTGPGGPLLPLLSTTDSVLYPYPGAGAPILAYTGQARMTFVKTQAHIPPGSYSVDAVNPPNLAILLCDRDGTRKDNGLAQLSAPVTINVAASGCTVASPGEENLPFGNFTANQFPTVGSTSGTRAVTVRLQCDPNVNLAFTITDQSNPANRTENITLTPDSTARGLEVQALDMRGGAGIYRLGPDSSAVGVENQYPIFNTGAGGEVDFPIGFQYIRTGTLTAGSANARVTLTFSYQ